MSRGRKRLKAFLILAIGPVSRDSTEGNEASTKASDLGIVDVVVVIGVVVGPGEGGDSREASVRSVVVVIVVVIAVVDEGSKLEKNRKGETFSVVIDEGISQVRCRY